MPFPLYEIAGFVDLAIEIAFRLGKTVKTETREAFNKLKKKVTTVAAPILEKISDMFHSAKAAVTGKFAAVRQGMSNKLARLAIIKF